MQKKINFNSWKNISDDLNKMIKQWKVFREGKYDIHPNKSYISHTHFHNMREKYFTRSFRALKNI